MGHYPHAPRPMPRADTASATPANEGTTSAGARDSTQRIREKRFAEGVGDGGTTVLVVRGGQVVPEI